MLRRLREAGNHVQVVATRSALEFIGAATFEALSGRPVLTGVFENVAEVEHVALGRRADLVVVVPATADLLARMAHGRADDLLTSTLLTARCPVLAVPAMHTEMWEHPATVDNVATLRRAGHRRPRARLRTPHRRRLAAPGVCPSPPEIAEFARLLLEWGLDDGGSRSRCRATSRAAASSSPPAAPPSRSTPCAPWATARRAVRATRWPGSRPSAAPM